jgi:hypothetical protein
MATLPVLAVDSPDKIPRPRRKKRGPTEDELRERIAHDKRALRQLRFRQREDSIRRLGSLAYKCGLSDISDTDLERLFTDIRRQKDAL